MTPQIVRAIGLLLIALIILIPGMYVYGLAVVPPDDSPQGTFELEVKSGDVFDDVAQKLEENNVIRSKESILFYETLFSSEPLQQGVYQLNVPSSPRDILDQIDQQSITKRSELALLQEAPTVTITFKEGETLDTMIQKLDEKGVSSRDDLMNAARDPSMFSTSDFPFLPEALNCAYGEGKNCPKYYLEGYLYPDTYIFAVPSTPEAIFKKMLQNFEKKVWVNIPQNVSPAEFHNAIIMASVIERETGRTKGVNESNRRELQAERRLMAGVFINRLENNMLWQSDPTVIYGTGLSLCQQTFTIPNCVYLDDPRVDTLYNTYKYAGYPIGPITSPQFDNVSAVLDPEENNYLFFVSDVTGKKYFSETEGEHFETIEKVQQINSDLGIE